VIEFAGCSFGDEERRAVNEVMDGTWLASGEQNRLFEEEFASRMGAGYGVCVNSGSSANLLALAALDLPKGSKVLTSGCGFPATLAPILHCGLDPILVDYDLDTHNIDLNQVEEKIGGAQALIFAHTMGNPVDLRRVMQVADKNNVPVIEDCCEAVGSVFFIPNDHDYRGGINYRSVGSFGAMGTYSFYPSHQMTALGTGGMVVTSDRALALRLRSLRDWGKVSDWDSYLGDQKTRYDFNGYFKQYTYETVGYNMKLSEAAAAFGRVQVGRLADFSASRRHNHYVLKKLLEPLSNTFISVREEDDSIPSWFGYSLTLRTDQLSRDSLSNHLEEKGIRTRPFFAGNITRHKPFERWACHLPVADKLMKDSLFVGVWQGITQENLEYMADTITAYVNNKGEIK